MTHWRATLGVALVVIASGCAGPVTSQQVPVTLPVPTTLKANLYKPAGSGPFPALVLLHGCGGISPNVIAWAQWLTAQGYVALVLDSFSGRGLSRMCADSAPLMGGARAPDVYAAAKHLKTVSFVDGERIGAIGWSHGGWTVLRAAALQQTEADVRIKALVAFYPYCGDVAIYRSSIPMLMLLGASDNWTPAEPCRLLAEAARRDGHDVTAFVYPNAHHGFDNVLLRQPATVAEARRGAGATIAYNQKAHEDSEIQMKRFLQETLGR
jgi:dienelactone hydrolase